MLNTSFSSNRCARIFPMVLLGVLLLPVAPAIGAVGLADTVTVAVNDLRFGHSMSEIGDLNGDGYDELLVGAPGFGQLSGSGRVCLWYGGPDVRVNPPVTWVGAAGDSLGKSVAAVGDVNDDGRPDWAVGAPGSNDGGSLKGKVYLYYGSSNPGAITPVEILGELGGDQFGFSVSAAGDFDRDGIDDLIVGAPYAAADKGAAYIIYGKSGGVSTDLADALRLEGEFNGDDFGWDVTDVGNFFGGTYEDCVAVGAPKYDNVGIDGGKVYVYQGGFTPNATVDLEIVITTGTASPSQYGWSVEGVGRWNTDSYDDLAIGAPTNNDGGSSAGRVDIVYGGLNPDAVADRTVTGSLAGGLFGFSLARVGDVTGSSADDVLVGAPEYNETTASKAGRAYLYAGGSTATSSSGLDLIQNTPLLPGTAPDDRFGYAVSSAGDFDGDGQPDYAVGARNGNHYNGARAGFARVFDSGGLAVPAFLKSWKAAWAAEDEPGLVNLAFAFAAPAASFPRVDIERRVLDADGRVQASERLWSGRAEYGADGRPGVLATDGEGFTFVDPGPESALGAGDRLDYGVTVLDESGQTLTLASLAGPAGAPAVLDVTLALDPAWPNPANPAVTVRFRAPVDERVTLQIYDVRGRLVRDLYEGPGTGDWQHEVWNGRTRDGVAAASGLYFIQLEDGRRALTRRVVLAR